MTVQPFLLRRNDRIVFLGDSITEQQLYTNYVENYLASRYPELKLTFFNAGWGGDSAPGGARRLDRDVLAVNPTVVTLCYGMNDGRYTQPTDEIRDTYVNGMRELVSRLKGANVRVVLLTPGMVDESVAPHLAAAHYNAQGLRRLADEVLKLAAAEHLPVADLHELMNDVDRRAKAADPTFCMIPDSVHPDPAGQLVMAFGLLTALGVPPRQQEIVVDMSAKRQASAAGLRAVIHATPHGRVVDLKLDRLPFFVEPAARKVLPFLPFQQTFNQLTLRLTGLQAEHACFRTEFARSPAIPRAELAAGINLFSFWSAGYMRQAETVHRYTVEKNLVYFKLWRVLGLNGTTSNYDNPKAHQAGIRMLPGLDRAREKLLTKSALHCRLNILATDGPGEPLGDGDFISQWNLRGPFPKPHDQDNLDTEAAFSATEPRLDSNWFAVDLDIGNYGNNLIQALGPQTDCFVYAVTLIDSPVGQDVQLLLGSDDGYAVWLNGSQLAANLALARGCAPDQETIPATLKPGRNVLLLKITQGMGNWGFCVRFRGLTKPVTAFRARN